MDETSVEVIKDGDPTRLQVPEAPSRVGLSKPLDVNVKKKRRRGNPKRKLMKPFSILPWQDRRMFSFDRIKRNNRFRKIALSKTHAPFNNNQFLMEIHKPEPENAIQIRTPSARTRDSSFSIDSEDNYFYSLPEDEEEYLTKEFSSVYEDAQSERLSNMSKNELIQEYLLLEAKYDTLVKRTERSKAKPVEDDSATDKDTSITDKDSMLTDKDTSGTSVESIEPSYAELLQHLKAQEDQIRDLQLTNEKLRLENEHLHQKSQTSSSEDSESDSSSTSDSDTSSSDNNEGIDVPQNEIDEASVQNGVHGQNAETDDLDAEPPLVNGFHSPN